MTRPGLVAPIPMSVQAGEPDPGRSIDRLMAHGSRRKTTIPCRFSTPIEFPRSPFVPPGINPGGGDILETALKNQNRRSKGDIWMGGYSWQAKPFAASPRLPSPSDQKRKTWCMKRKAVDSYARLDRLD